jgi:methylenetetrahydrofolate dehydrogenase (NADP+)/methenyltetrahydrofolate cyclohydrolase
MKLIDGRAMAEKIRAEAAREAKRLKLSPGLGVVLVGDDPASHLYVGLKESACAEAGIHFEKFLLADTASTKDVIDIVTMLNRRDDIQAVLVQLPLPVGIDAHAVTTTVDPAKDVDGFHPANLRAYLTGEPVLEPGLVTAIRLLVEAAGVSGQGRRAVVVGNSRVFAEPVKKGLEHHGYETDIVLDLEHAEAKTREADLIVIAVGHPGWLTADKVKKNAVVIDVGTSRVAGRTVGDADLTGLERLVSAITPVPGGVGPMTVAMLIKNAIELAKRKSVSS